MATYSPKLTNVAGTADYTSSGRYEVLPGGFVAVEIQINPKGEINSKTGDGFGVTLPVPAKSGIRHVLNVWMDGRTVDRGNWAGQAVVFSGDDGSALTRVRVTGTSNGAALENVRFFYGGAEGEILTISGVYSGA